MYEVGILPYRCLDPYLLQSSLMVVKAGMNSCSGRTDISDLHFLLCTVALAYNYFRPLEIFAEMAFYHQANLEHTMQSKRSHERALESLEGRSNHGLSWISTPLTD